jgi:hypothetical protein
MSALRRFFQTAVTLVVATVALVALATASGPAVIDAAPAKPFEVRLSVPSHGPDRVVLFGDSLAWEAADDLIDRFAGDDRIELRQRTFGGTALCDWFTELDEVLEKWRPRLVVAAFSGNNLTPCMDGYEEGAAYAAKYLADARHYAATAEAHGARVLFVSPPARRDAPGLGHPAQVAYAQVSTESPRSASWVYGGRDVTPGDVYTDVLPCGPGDACVDDGLVSVRHPDGLHFCPSGTPVTPGARCDVDSPGARRFALTIADAIRDALE